MKVPPISGRKVYQFRMEPTELEALELERTASVARHIYNWALARCQEYYQQHGKRMPGGQLSAELTQLKQTEWWLYDFDSQMLQQVLADLRRAYINFLRAPGQVPQVQDQEALPAGVSYPATCQRRRRTRLCAVGGLGQDSAIAGHRIPHEERYV